MRRFTLSRCHQFLGIIALVPTCWGIVSIASGLRKMSILQEQDVFIRHWTPLLQKVQSPEQFAKRGGKTNGVSVVRVFADDSWIAVRSHSSHDTGNWDLTLLKDSNGDVWRSTHHFCGEEGTRAEIFGVKAGNAREFQTQAVSLSFQVAADLQKR